MSQEEKPWFNHSQMIANIMSARMKELGMIQKMLAEKMNCTQQYISKILKGRENLSLEAINKIENALDIHFLQMNSHALIKCNDKKDKICLYKVKLPSKTDLLQLFKI